MFGGMDFARLNCAGPQLTHGTRHIEYWYSKAARVQKSYDRLTGNSPKDFVNSIVQKMISDSDNEGIPLSDAVDVVSGLLKWIQQAENGLLEQHGLCNKYQQVLAITKWVRELCMWLEDVQCYFLLDTSELQSAFIEHKLLYQIK